MGNINDHGMYLGPGAFQRPPPTAESKQGLADPLSQQQIYDRVKERQLRLQALRHGLDIDEQEASDLASLPSDMVDHKSLISANSYTKGKITIENFLSLEILDLAYCIS